MNTFRNFIVLLGLVGAFNAYAGSTEDCSYTQCYYFLSENRTQEAIAACTQAVEEGGIDVAVTLGTIYHEGIGDQQPNYQKAIEWYRYGAENSAYTAQWRLGMMYYHGEGLTKDLVEAYAWLDVGTRFDDQNVINERDKIADEMTEGQLKEARALAAEYKKDYSDFQPAIHCGIQTESDRAGK